MKIVAVMDGDENELKRLFASVRKVAHVSHPHSMPYEHFDVYYCRGLEKPLRQFWPSVKN